LFRILLAEDEEHIAKLIDYKLRKEGLEVRIAKNGQEAVSALEEPVSEQPFSLLILDVMMPILDGWQVLKKLRTSMEERKDLPVLMLTAKSSEMDLAKSAELGATRFLKKPFDPAALHRVVVEMLESGAKS